LWLRRHLLPLAAVVTADIGIESEHFRCFVLVSKTTSWKTYDCSDDLLHSLPSIWVFFDCRKNHIPCWARWNSLLVDNSYSYFGDCLDQHPLGLRWKSMVVAAAVAEYTSPALLQMREAWEELESVLELRLVQTCYYCCCCFLLIPV